ncbi:hypothetical protein Tco_1185115 [Tanacetum coccineum]
MDQKLHTYSERQSDNKRKADDSSKNNHGHQQPTLHGQNVQGLPIWDGEGSLMGIFAQRLRSTGNTNVVNTQKGNGQTTKEMVVFGVWSTRAFKRDCPKKRGNARETLMPISSRLRRCHAVIVCDEKLVQIPYGNETLTFYGNTSSNGKESRLTVISCSKAQEYMAKGCHVFLAQISAKKEEDKSKGKQIKDVPIVRDFLEDLPGLPLARPVEFQIDLIPGAAPVARALYRLTPS